MSTDIAIIKQTLAAYCHAVDRGDASDVSALFTKDAISKPYFDGDYDVTGRAAIEGWYSHYHDNFRASIRHLKHMIMSPLITLSGDHAQSSCYLLASAVNNETDEAFFVTGTYSDTLLKVGNTWQFEVRQIDVDFMAPQGKVLEQFPSLGYPGA